MTKNERDTAGQPLKRMEDLFNSNYVVRSFYVFGTGLALLLMYFFLKNLDSMGEKWHETIGLLTPFIWGICIAYILMPLFNWLQEQLGRCRPLARHRRVCLTLSLIITMLLFFSLLGIFFSMVIPEISRSVISLFNILTNSNSYTELREYAQAAMDYLDELGLIGYLEELGLLSNGTAEMPDSLRNYFENPQEYLSALVSYSLSALLKAGVSAKNILLAFIVSIYMMIGKETFLAQSRKIIYACTTQDRAEHFLDFCRRTNRIFSGFISGKILDSLLIGIICFVGMQLLGLDYSTLISLIIGVTNVIPFFGPFIGAIPSILLLLIISPKQALIFAAFVLALQQFDGNILGPRILGNATGLTPFWVIFAVIVMGSALGLVGMFIGVPIFATIYMIVKNTVETRLRNKNLPVSTDNYRQK